MLNVVAVHRANGLWAVDNGYEFPLTLAAVAATLGFTGPGAASTDAWLGLPAGGLEIGLFTVALGFLAGTAVVLSRVAARSEGGPAAEPPAKEVVIEKIAA
jgi:putative oxidoreductase